MLHKRYMRRTCTEYRQRLTDIPKGQGGQGRDRLPRHSRRSGGGWLPRKRFRKGQFSEEQGVDPAEALKEAVLAAGKTRLSPRGRRESDYVKLFLQKLHDQIHIAGAAGNATGRNIHQKSLEEAVRNAQRHLCPYWWRTRA